MKFGIFLLALVLMFFSVQMCMIVMTYGIGATRFEGENQMWWMFLFITSCVSSTTYVGFATGRYYEQYHSKYS